MKNKGTLKSALKQGQKQQQKTGLRKTAGKGPVIKQRGKQPPPPPLKKQTHKQRPPVFPFVEWDSILFVGEGNFSFAHAVAEKLHGACTIVATSFDDHETLNAKYPDAQEHIDAIRELGGTMHYGVDATNLTKWKAGKKSTFSKIVFNFPHVGAGIKDQDRNIFANQQLLAGFFQSALSKLAIGGEILVTLKTGEPYDSWDMKTQAKSTNQLTCTRSFEFVPALYPEYAHRRTIGFVEGLSREQNEEITKAPSRTIVFSQRLPEGVDPPKIVLKRPMDESDSE
ncbi:hypothetical protein HKX48_000355 [Thoreauomyces humboldtii]|nr:hypothetical protein HKX48_000355 [Thoreauomyces humboldtii]